MDTCNAKVRCDRQASLIIERYKTPDGGKIKVLDASPGDLNCSGSTDTSDGVYLVNFIVVGGPIPSAACR